MLTTPATLRCLTVAPITGAGRLLALADVEVELAGVPLTIHGVQVYADAHGTEIRLPKYRAASGEWLPAVSLPEEVRGPLGDVVIAAAIEAGVLMEREAG